MNFKYFSILCITLCFSCSFSMDNLHTTDNQSQKNMYTFDPLRSLSNSKNPQNFLNALSHPSDFYYHAKLFGEVCKYMKPNTGYGRRTILQDACKIGQVFLVDALFLNYPKHHISYELYDQLIKNTPKRYLDSSEYKEAIARISERIGREENIQQGGLSSLAIKKAKQFNILSKVSLFDCEKKLSPALFGTIYADWYSEIPPHAIVPSIFKNLSDFTLIEFAVRSGYWELVKSILENHPEYSLSQEYIEILRQTTSIRMDHNENSTSWLNSIANRSNSIRINME